MSDGATNARLPSRGAHAGQLLSMVRGGSVQQVVRLARKHLGMDVAFVAEFHDGRQVYRRVDGDAEGFGFLLDDGPPLPGTYCRGMTAGEIPNVIPDARSHPAVRDLPITREARIGSYVGVPIHLRDGTLYGSFCCLSHDSNRLDARDAKFLLLLAELVAVAAEAERERERAHRRIEHLLDHDDLLIALQPIANLGTGQVVGVEALTRFPAGYARPDLLFAQAHEVGLGADLELLALRHALTVLPLLDRGQYLAVNLAPQVAVQLADPASAQLPWGRLVVEITEHATIEDYAAVREALAPARARGLRLAVDDAGAGYACLRHIVELRPEMVKIDRSLVEGIATDRHRRSVCAALVTLAQDVGATVVAEGIEHGEDLRVLRQMGIDLGQGYLLARPSTDRADLAVWRHDRLGPAAPTGRSLAPAHLGGRDPSPVPGPRFPTRGSRCVVRPGD